MFLDVTWLERPKLFISSTMDKNTKNTRLTMIKELKDEGYEIVEFQSAAFPYSNHNDNSVIEETINAVAKANVFIMIVDDRYGYIDESGLSVTHREYRKALELNLPLYIFINKAVWEDFTNNRISDKDNIKSQSQYNFIKELANYKITEFESSPDCINHIKQQLLNFLGGCLKFSSRANWLWSEGYTRSIEGNASEIWIVTPDFLWDFDDIMFHQIVLNNVSNRGSIYKYIYKETLENNYKKDEMLRKFKMELEHLEKDTSKLNFQIQFLPIKPNKFYWACEQIIFNPYSRKERAIMVDIMDVRDKTLKFNIEFGFGKRLIFREQFVNYWNNHIKDNQTIIDIGIYSE